MPIGIDGSLSAKRRKSLARLRELLSIFARPSCKLCAAVDGSVEKSATEIEP
jgi:hypothetical protein